MWIIPKTLSAFVQDTEGLNLDLEERAWMLESSAMWRSKPSSKQTWLRRLKKGGWITPLSTRILKPSQQKYFEEKFTESLGATLVSRSVARGSEKEKKTQDTYGHTSDSMSGQLDLFGAFSKMSEATPRWGYGESCPIWKKMVTERSGDCSARRKQARLTNASESSSWPTATARDHKGCYKTLVRKDGKPRGDLLPDAVNIAEQNWPTPTAMSRPRSEETMEKCLKFRKSKGKNSVPLYLEEKVRKEENWPTPRAGNPGSRKPGTGGKILAEEAKKNWPTATTNDATGSKYQYSQGDHNKKVLKLCGAVEQHAGPPAQEKSSTSGKNHGSWPTARSSDAEGGRIKTERTEKGFRSKREKSDQYFGAKLRDAAEMEKPPTMKLNPNWVEQLMGLPIGWTDLGSWATESSHKPQN